VEDWHSQQNLKTDIYKERVNEFLLDKNIRKISIIKNDGNLSIVLEQLHLGKQNILLQIHVLLIVFCNSLLLRIWIKIKSKI